MKINYEHNRPLFRQHSGSILNDNKSIDFERAFWGKNAELIKTNNEKKDKDRKQKKHSYM